MINVKDNENGAENKKKRSGRYDINRPERRHAHKYTKYILSQYNMVICIKEHLNNIWSSIHEKVKQHWVRVKKKRFL